MILQPLSLNLNKNEDSLEFLEDEVFDISEFLIDPDEEVPEPIPIIAFENKGRTIPIFTEDNISMIQGRAKSRKSTVLKVEELSTMQNFDEFMNVTEPTMTRVS